MNLSQPNVLNKTLLRLFGYAQVWLNGQQLELGQRKTLALLAFVALEGRVSRNKLMAVFWAEFDEETARRNLRRELHRLRQAGLRDALQTPEDHVCLEAGYSTDVQWFEAAAKSGNLESALDVYQSELLSELRIEPMPMFEAWLEEWRGRLAEQRKHVQLELAERLETKGDWTRALLLHQAVLQTDPLQEAQHREVMRLQYLLGHREAALRQFEHCKQILHTELDLEPLPITLQLAQQIRMAQQGSPLESGESVQVLTAPSWVAPFIGRTTALAALENSQTPLTIVLGEAGIGKTRLLEVFAPQALQVQFRAISSQTPLYAMAESLREALNDPEIKARFDALEPIWQLEAARLLPELQPNTNKHPAQERRVFLEGLARVLLGCAGHLLVIEDLHWADESSLELLAHLLRRSSHEAQILRICATARAEELSSQTQDLLETLRQDQLLTSLELEPLPESEVIQLTNSVNADAAFAKKLLSVTAGNSFYICESLRHWLENNTEAGIAPSIRRAVLQRVEKLGSATQRLLETAALCEDGFCLEDILPATALSDWEGIEAFEQAVHAHILKTLESGYGFIHDLTRQALQSTLSLERQRFIHRKLAEALEGSSAPPARIAAHFEQAGYAHKAVPWRIRAAEQAEAVYAHHHALEQYQQALEHLPSDTVKLKILQARLGIWEKLGQHSAWQADLEQLETIALQLDKSSTLIFAKAKFALAQNQPETALHCAQWVLDSITDNLTRAEAHFWAGAARLQQSQLEYARIHFQDALKLLPHSAILRGKVLMQLFQVEFDAGNTEATKILLEQALAHNKISKNQVDHIQILNHQGRLALNEGDNENAVKIFETALQKVVPMNNPTLERTILMGVATSYSRILRLDEALGLLERALHLAEITDALIAKGGIYHTIGAIHRRRLDYGLTLKHYLYSLEIAQQTQQHPARIFRNLTLADLYLDLGDHNTAKIYLEQAASIIEQTGVRTEIEWLQILQARQQCQAGDVKTARAALEGQEPQNRFDRVIWLTELALIRLADADYQGVLQLLKGEDAPDNTLSMLLGIRLQAMAALGQALKPELEQMHALIKVGHLIPIFSLRADVALARVYRVLGKTKHEKNHRVAALRQVQHTAIGLEDYPVQRHAWLEQHAEIRDAK